MYFEPHSLVEQLLDDVAQMPGALPLLSFTLSELYLRYLKSCRDGLRDNRTITQQDYEELGGVARSLTQRADCEYEQLVKLNIAYAQTIRHVMLRMIAVGGIDFARRRVQLTELEYPPGENERVKEVIYRFTDARLLVKGEDIDGNLYVEPAHDALVHGWHKLLVWKHEDEESLILQRQLTPAILDWIHEKSAPFLWNNNPRLSLLKQVLNSNDNWLNKVEAEFVRQSIKRKNKVLTRNCGITVVAALLLIGSTTIAIIKAIDAQNKLLEYNNLLAENLFTSGRELDALEKATETGKILL